MKLDVSLRKSMRFGKIKWGNVQKTSSKKQKNTQIQNS